MMYPRLLSVAFTAFVLSLASQSANAQILLNGGFELPGQPAGLINSGVPTDWTTDVDFLVSNGNGVFGNTPYGSQFVVMDEAPLSQTVSGFTQGQTYVFGFDFAYESGTQSSPLIVSLSGADDSRASFDLTTMVSFDATIPFQSTAIVFTAASSGSITFSFSDVGAVVALDNVGLYGNIVPPPPTTPEPSTYAEMLLGLVALAGFGLMRRRCARA